MSYSSVSRGYVLSTLSDLTSPSIVEVSDVCWAVETGDSEPAIQPGVRTLTGRYDLNHDPGPPGRLGQPLDRRPGRRPHTSVLRATDSGPVPSA
jgi:hypothetical protein